MDREDISNLLRENEIKESGFLLSIPLFMTFNLDIKETNEVLKNNEQDSNAKEEEKNEEM